MERFTFSAEKKEEEGICGSPKYISPLLAITCYERLSEYEDTGLMPAEINELDNLQIGLLEFGCKYCVHMPCVPKNDRCLGFRVDVERVVADLEKQSPKEVKTLSVYMSGETTGTCRSCFNTVSTRKNYCPHCGQKIREDE